jgi:hypothetical protein
MLLLRTKARWDAIFIKGKKVKSKSKAIPLTGRGGL